MSTVPAGGTPAPGARTAEYPTVRVAGDARERGRSYGAQAGDRVATSIRGYEVALRFYSGWGWSRVREEALRFEGPIGEVFPSYLEEMRGIAEGAEVELADVLAVNVRTEIMFAGQARTAAAQRGIHPPSECSAVGVLPEVAESGHTMLAQNWDWMEHCFDTVVVLEVEQPDAPNFVSVVEAGLLAKTGMNDAGLGVCTNALVTTGDLGEPGIPYHVMLRAFMDRRTPSEAISVAQAARRSSSANYLIGHADGVVLDMESEPGDLSMLHLVFPTPDGLLLHTNHFLSDVGDRELSVWSMPDSPIRLDRLRRALTTAPRPIAPDSLMTALADHANFPTSICCHPDARERPEERGATVVSVLMDLDERRLWIASGNPCASPFVEHPLGDLLGREGRP
jgi:isopenicillin-N N-acyltransferase-like protein